MEPKRLRKQWRRALKFNLARTTVLLRRRGPLNAVAVHDLRVALRRARLLLQLRSKHRDRDRIKRHRAAARRILDAFAPARDIDVTLEWVRTRHVSPELLTRLLQRRARHCREAERKLARLKPGLGDARVRAAGRVDADKLDRRYHRWLAAISARCLATAQRSGQLSVPELHALRRDIRRWRYLRELATTCQSPERDRIVRLLVAAQTSLGAIQDGEVILRQLQSCGRSGEVVALKKMLKQEFDSGRELAVEELTGFARRLPFVKR